MMETGILIFLALCLAAFFVVFVVAFAYVAHQLHKLILLIGMYRSSKRFFKKIERFRRDFNK